MTEEVFSNKPEKFYFNINIFDEDDVDENSPEAAPPPPTFSEQELATAERAAFEKGKQQGIDETKKSRSELIARTLESISQETPSLFQNEASREKIYEQETVRLSLEIFKKLYPLYQKKLGFEELKETISSILKKQQGQKEITIYVKPDALEGTQKMLLTLPSRGIDTKFQVLADEALSDGACKMSWKDGGAISNPENIAHEIRTTIEQVLAADGAKGHDEIIDAEGTEKETDATIDEDKTAKAQNAEITEKPDE